MAEFIAGAQALAVNDLVAFEGSTKRCSNVVHRAGSGLFTLKGGSCCNPAKYMVHLHVVITAATTDAEQLIVYVDGEPVSQTVIGFPPVAVGTLLSGDVAFMVESACACTKLSVHAVTPVALTAAIINIDRVA